MVTHLEFRLHGGFATTTRLVARLHGLGVEVDELHVSAERMCVHLTHDGDAPRVRAVLMRNADVQPLEPGHEALPRTTYVVWSEPLEASGARHHHGRRISA